MLKYRILVENFLKDKVCTKLHSKSDFLKKYYRTDLNVLGLSLPVQRQISKDGFEFSNQPIEVQLRIWDDIFHTTDLHEAKFQALFFLESVLKKINNELIWEKAKHWVKGIDNWAHSDLLSSVYSKMLEQNGDMIYPQLVKWNISKFHWERRQSVVSLLYYRRNRKKFLAFEKMISLVENLLEDEEYYVQKGVGWTLRELWQVDEKMTEQFLLKNLSRISSIAYIAAVEKVPVEKRNEWKLNRKDFRSKKA